MFGKLLQPEVTFRLKMHKKAFGDRQSLGPHGVRGYITPTDLLADLRGWLCGREGGRKGIERRDRSLIPPTTNS